MKALTGIAAAAVLLLVPSTASAQADLPVREAKGVKIVRPQGAIVVVFTDKATKLYRQIKGMRAEVSCTEMMDDGVFGGTFTGTSPIGRRHGRRLRTGDATRRIDYCRVWRPRQTVRRNGKRRRVDRRLIVSIPLSQKGAVFLDEEAKVRLMFQIELLAGIVQEREKLEGWPTYDQLVAEVPEIARRVVALAAPGDTPAAGRVGYYSDGNEHAAVVMVSASGRRLFIEHDADDVLRTNVAEHIFGEPD
jgi:hypothetical protein